MVDAAILKDCLARSLEIGAIVHVQIDKRELAIKQVLSFAENQCWPESGIIDRRRAAVGYVPSDPRLVFSGVWGTVRDEIEALSMHFDSRADGLVDAFGLGKFCDRPASTLSGGECARAAIALTAATKPRLWVLDRCLEWLEDAWRTTTANYFMREVEAGVPVLELASRRSWIGQCSAGRVVSTELCNAGSGDGLRPDILGQRPNGHTVPKGDPLLEVNRLSISVGSNTFGPFSLTGSAGERITVVGPNGSGKSTFGKACCGLLPYDGTVKVLGEVPASRKQWARAARYAIQNPVDQIYMKTVRDEICGRSTSRKQPLSGLIEQTVAVLGLAPYLDDDPLQLPHCLKRLVSIAGAYAAGTPVVVLDEPSAFLLQEHCDRLGALLSGPTTVGRLVLCITHDQDFAKSVGTRTIALQSVSQVR